MLHNTDLPLPLSEDAIKRQTCDAFPIHLHIMAYIEGIPEVQPIRQQVNRPSWNWCARTVSKIHGKWATERKQPSKNVLKKTIREFHDAIIGKRTFNPNDFMRNHLTKQSIQRLEIKTQTTIQKIANNNFQPATYQQPRGWLKVFSALPNHDYRLLHISVDLAALYEIVNHSFPEIMREFRKSDFIDNKEECWETLFDTSKLKGIDGFYKFCTGFMTTNGVHCGVLCMKPRRQRQPILTPTTVVFKDNSIVWGADPGIRSLLVLENASGAHGSDHPRCTIELKASEYHDKTLHNIQRRHHLQRLVENADVATFFEQLPEKITSVQATFEEYLRAALPDGMYIRAIQFNEQSLSDVWHSTIKKHKVLDQFAERIRAVTPHIPKNDIVIAYGAANFFHAMPGHRAVPTKTLQKTLSRHLTVVPTSEFRTSQQCSHLCSDVYVRMANVYDDDDLKYALKYCETCQTFWNRDVNASRNIRHRLLCENSYNAPDNRFQG